MKYWLVGADYQNNVSENIDMSEKFISNGYWENGYDDKFVKLVNSIKIGDKIAIKSTHTQIDNLPFDNKYRHTVSCMPIKAIGVVTKNHQNGKRIDVNWDSSFELKTWYFSTYFQTIHKVLSSKGWKQKALYDFIFMGKPQDISRFRNDSKWQEKFGDGFAFSDADLSILIGNTPPLSNPTNPVIEKRGKPDLVDIPKQEKSFPRDISVAKEALALAKYCCEYDKSHESFKRKRAPQIDYTEPHHLIPISAYDDFEFSLDNIANICSLCSTCHNCVHYGVENERNLILKKLYNERKENLKIAGLEITFSELKEYYK